MTSKYYYGQFTEEHLKLLKTGISLYNEEKFWECHEEVEDLWLADYGDDARYVYWVVIQVATSLYHYLDDNLNGAEGMIRKAKRKLEICEKKNVETELLYKYLSWEKFKKIIRKIPEKSKIEDYNELYSFKFKNPNHWDKL
ncbi:hypothetical protein BIY24_01245 [Halobacteriovorax marinus]|uniref:DUF309 domain-containing protein n=1 Tax=Halobacteriovorax marinus (strain ATCC BAA-682 / DSM 15412 / SJ) TaxID=862908 RepID=E1X382_HALMS|nr:DUF309 domain-containing protein [Halobacteriovorax marinus]ATH06606.1 hypothetical protein BIY24_01245 [Halobacteriovorax marinus]CBW25177.1 hypothetical protein BMS_0247 [Halobacteriovorax marinus SJ]